MESETFGRWLGERGCSFEVGRDTSGAQGHAYVTVRCGYRRVSSHRSDPRSGLTPES